MNPFDTMQVARDVVRHDYADELYKKILAEQNMCKTAPTRDRQYDMGVEKGLELALNILDGEMTWLRERWG